MTDKELLEKSALRFRLIADDTQKITTGNLSHNLTCLRGFALRAAESIEKHMQEEPVSEELEYASEKYACRFSSSKYGHDKVKDAFIAGANWKAEPVSEELEEAADNALSDVLNTHEIVNVRSCLEMFRLGSKWKEQQFEKNRLKHCDELTKEQAQIESDFVTQHLKETNRTPTFIDAIEYGMRLHEEQMMAKAIDGEVGYWNLRGLSVNVKLPRSVGEGDKVKVLVVKED